MHGARGPRHVGGKMSLRLYSGRSGSLRRGRTRAVSRGGEQQQPQEPSPAAAGATETPGPIFTQFSAGETGQGGGLGARVQKNERALPYEGAKT